MDCSKNFHSSLDFVNSASKHSVVQHCTAGVSKQSKHYIYNYIYNFNIFLRLLIQLFCISITRGPITRGPITRGPTQLGGPTSLGSSTILRLGHCIAFQCIECIEMRLDAMHCPFFLCHLWSVNTIWINCVSKF